MFVFFRAIYVFCVLVPWLLRYLRDTQSFLLFGPPRIVSPEEHARRARAMTERIARMGPAFIKAAQVLAMREDLIPKAYTEQLKTLQDRAPAFSARRARQIIEEDLGRPLADLFERFDPEPIAAASLGQVHRARFRGREVAVKARRPGIERIVRADLAALTALLRLVGLFMDNYILRGLWTVSQEFARMIFQEMDFRNEVKNAARLRRNLRRFPYVIVPECVEELTSPRVCVFEFHEGVRVDDVERLRERGVSPEELVGRLIEVYVSQVVLDGFVHADPHPGNLLIDAQGRLILLDYGMAVDLDPAVKLELLKLIAAIARNDLDAIVDGFYRLRLVEPGINSVTLRDAARTLMSISFGTEYSPRLIQEICEDIYKTFYKFPLRLPQSLVYLLRASALVEGIGIAFDPRFNGARVAKPIIKRLIREVPLDTETSPVSWLLGQGRKLLGQWEEFTRLLQMANREELRLRLHPMDHSLLQRYYQAMVRRITWSLAATATAITGALIYLKTGHLGVLLACSASAILLFAGCLLFPLGRPKSPEDT